MSDDFIKDKGIRDARRYPKTNTARYTGVGGGQFNEIKTNYEKVDTERIIEGSSNCYIILGKDRDAGITSGLGGRGESGVSSIDLIAGHMGAMPIDDLFSEKVYSGKDFKKDASRVYLSQKADIDEYFEIPKIQAKLGSIYIDLEVSRAVAAVTLKSDCIRIIGRENIKIVTFHKGINSDNKATFDGGIDIVAGCNALATGLDKTLSLQPMVKGNNLIELLKEIITRIEDTQKTVAEFMKKQKDINDKMSKHVHQSGAAGTVTSDMVGNDVSMSNFTLLTEVLPDIVENFMKTSLIQSQYFTPLNEKYINSVWNRVN